MDKYKEVIKKIDLSHEINMDIGGNFGRTMTITMSEAFLFKKLLKEKLTIPVVSSSNKAEKELIIGVITGHGFTTLSNHGFLKVLVRYGHYKIEDWKVDDEVELIITR